MSDNCVSSSEFISFMIESGALLFGDFTLKSGRKSPYFINTGEYKTGAQLSRLGDFYAGLIRSSLSNDSKPDAERLNFNVLFGPAYKGIPLVTAAASKLSSDGFNFNVSFDRKERKDHGEGSVIMGYCPQDGDKIAIVEDVTTAGTSVREVMKLLSDLNIDAKVAALYISVDRMERSTGSGTGSGTAISRLKNEYGIDVYSIVTIKDIIAYLENPPDNCISVSDGRIHADNIRKYLSAYGGTD